MTTAKRRPPRLVLALSIADRTVNRWIARRGKDSGNAGITGASAGVLFFLAPRDRVAVSEIAEALHGSAAGTTGLLNRLAEAGLLTKEPDHADARVVRVSITDAGREAVALAAAALAELNAELTRGFTDDELNTVHRWLVQAGALEGSRPNPL